MSAFTDVLANIIRTVDGKHDLGAGELAERIEVELAKAGIAITQLPEPEVDGEWLDGGVYSGAPDRVRCYLEDPRMTADDARALAAALLAAAASIPTKETPNA